MNVVIYFSCSGQSKAVAERLGKKLNFEVIEYTFSQNGYENAVLVFPVHCQGAPLPFKKFLKNFKAKYITYIALYGRMSAGNAIYEAYKIAGNAVAGAYLPAAHTYGGVKTDPPDIPEEIIKKISAPAYISLPRRLKAPFAGLFPSARSRAIIKIKKNEKCASCGVCENLCPAGAIKNGEINSRCIRCLKCVSVCPHNALTVKKSFILKRYLRKPRFTETLIYI